MGKYGLFQTLTPEQAERFKRGEPIEDWTYDPETFDTLAWAWQETLEYLAEYQPPCGADPKENLEYKRASAH